MEKAILISIQSPHVCNILNYIKLLEIRKKFPKDYVGWVYIYCTKGKTTFEKTLARYHDGKVVARFWCDRVIDFFCYTNDLLKQACLTEDELLDYLGDKDGYAIHITNLEIFDKPKELKSFLVHSHTVSGIGFKGEKKQFDILKPLNRAPQSWCYVEL